MNRTLRILAATMAIGGLAFAVLPGAQAQAQDAAAVSLILKNNSAAAVDVGLVDQYGGNFTATVEGGMGQNQTLQAGSEIQVGGAAIHTVSTSDEGAEIVVAE